MSFIFSSNLLSHKDGCAASKLDNTLLENEGRFSALSESHSFAEVDDKLKQKYSAAILKSLTKNPRQKRKSLIKT